MFAKSKSTIYPLNAPTHPARPKMYDSPGSASSVTGGSSSTATPAMTWRLVCLAGRLASVGVGWRRLVGGGGHARLTFPLRTPSTHTAQHPPCI
jgi:hypothetical protein